MERDKEELTEHQSLLIIQQMINTAKQEQKDDGKGWIIWGWMLFIASVGTVINMHFHFVSTFFFWNAFGVFTVLFAIYEAINAFILKKQVRVKTYTNEIFKKLNGGFFICLMFIIIGMNKGFSPIYGFPLLMNLYAFWILIYGTVLNFKPSVIGAFAMWALAFIALFFGPSLASFLYRESGDSIKWVRTFEVVMILHAAGVLFGYIIPGHIANREFKKIAGRNLPNKTGSV